MGPSLVQLHHSPCVSFAAGALTYSSIVGLAYTIKLLMAPLQAPASQDRKATVAESENKDRSMKSAWPAAADLSVCALFTWQGAQKMLLQEASRHGPTSLKCVC